MIFQRYYLRKDNIDAAVFQTKRQLIYHNLYRVRYSVFFAAVNYIDIKQIYKLSFIIRRQFIITISVCGIMLYKQIDNRSERFNQIVGEIEIVKLVMMKYAKSRLEAAYTKLFCDSAAQNRIAIV